MLILASAAIRVLFMTSSARGIDRAGWLVRGAHVSPRLETSELDADEGPVLEKIDTLSALGSARIFSRVSS